MRRREFLGALGAAAILSVTAHALQGGRMRRVGVLFAASADDREYQGRIAAFTQALTKLGWIDGSNMRIDTRWGTTDSTFACMRPN